MIFGDSREMRTECFRPENGGVDQIIFLKEGQNWSYDFLVVWPFPAGGAPRELRVERKAIGDFAASMFNGDKLTRQVSYVDALIIEMDPIGISDLLSRYDDQDVTSFQKRLMRMTAIQGEYDDLWVIFSFGPQHTMRLLRFIESGKAIRGRGNRPTK